MSSARRPGRSVPEAQRRTARVVLRVPPEVAAWVRAEAARERVSVSKWVVNRIRGKAV